MAIGIKNVLFPLTIQDFLNQLCLSYNLSKSAGTSVIYALLEGDVLKETAFRLRFLDTIIETTTSLEDLDSFIRQLTKPTNDVSLSASFPTKPSIESGIEVVATMPLDENLVYLDEIAKLRDSFGEIIGLAQETLRISSPYIEQPGLNLILTQFEKAANHGVTLKLLTRIDDAVKPNMRQIMAILTLYNLFRGKIEVRTFSRTVGSVSNQLSLGGVHAKLMIADSRKAYVGSGEIRDHSLNRNFEVGLVIDYIDTIKTINKLFESVWSISEIVTIEYCRKFVK